jgi:hypothetical protein
VIWGWTAPAVVAVVILILAIAAANTIHTDDVQQQVANLAFAEKAYKDAHGTYTNELSDLSVSVDSRVSVHVWANEDKFCVDAIYKPRALTSHTYQDQFTPDGQLVKTLGGLCDGRISPAPPPVTEPPSETPTLESFVGAWSYRNTVTLVIMSNGRFYIPGGVRGRTELHEDALILIPIEGDPADVTLWGDRLLMTAGDCPTGDRSCGVWLRRWTDI